MVSSYIFFYGRQDVDIVDIPEDVAEVDRAGANALQFAPRGDHVPYVPGADDMPYPTGPGTRLFV